MDNIFDTLLVQNILHGLNLLTVIGFVVMGVGLNQSRQGARQGPDCLCADDRRHDLRRRWDVFWDSGGLTDGCTSNSRAAGVWR